CTQPCAVRANRAVMIPLENATTIACYGRVMGWQLERHSEGNATLCGRRWLDAHFAARAQSCEQAVRSIGIEPGWSVLDAGCGTGPFLPWLGELVGASGKLNALDIAADHVAYVQRLGEELPCELIATRG